MNLSLKHLEVFYTVMTYGSLTNASAVLCISQPAASKALKLAEYRLGFTLFKRIKGKLQPTQEAYILFDKMKPIYHDLNNLQRLAQNLANNPHGQISIGCLPSLGLSAIPQITAKFIQDNPGVFVSIGTHHTEDLYTQLLNYQIDLAIAFEPETDKGLISTPIIEVPLVYIDSAKTHRSPIKMDTIDENRWIHPNAHSLAGVINQYRVFDKSIVNVQTYYMAAEFVKQGIGCSITDLLTAIYMLPKEMIYTLDPKLTVKICLVHHTEAKHSQIIQSYIDILQSSLEKQVISLNQML